MSAGAVSKLIHPDGTETPVRIVVTEPPASEIRHLRLGEYRIVVVREKLPPDENGTR
jgi:hypothetical protein